MRILACGGALLMSLFLSAAPARAQPAAYFYTGGIPAWYTWYGYPAKMSFYYGPAAFLVPTAAVAVPTRPMVEVAAPARQEVVVDRPVVEKECADREPVALYRDRAIIRVEVPEHAKVWFQNVPTKQRGTDRVFKTPTIDPDKTLTYTVKAAWMENGREVTYQEKVTARPGRELTINFMAKANGLYQTRLEELPRP